MDIKVMSILLLLVTKSDVRNWNMIKRGDERQVIIFERKILRNIYEPRFDWETKSFDRKTTELFYRPKIIAFIKNKQLEWFRHTWRADDQLIKKKKKQNKTPKETKDPVGPKT